MPRNLQVNGTVHEFEVEDDTPLLWVLRDTLGLTGTKYGCGAMVCGACTVLIDGVATRTCGLPIQAVGEGQAITTIEGLPGAERDPVQKAWAELNVAQCGYCQSGMVLQAVALLREKPAPTAADIDAGMTNLCRCGTYQLVRAAIGRAAATLQGGRSDA
jgi:isoquinoline 1-oxidoreductase alpha subunit